MADLRRFLLGSTVRVSISISAPGTSKPIDPDSVEVVSFERLGTDGYDDVALPGAAVLEQVDEGEFLLRIPTSNLVVGSYRVTLAAQTGALDRTVVEDSFVLA